MRDQKATGSYVDLIRAGEPFRLLFPLGVLIGIGGVLMWPLFVWHFTSTYPGVEHPRVMIEGFLTCFIVGFLGTALPRLLDVPRFTLGETFAFAAALLAVAVCHWCGRLLWGDPLFFCTLVAFIFALIGRAFARKDTPPPAFVLVAMGLLSGLAGSAIQAFAENTPDLLNASLVQTGRLLLNQGYLLLPIMGIGAFLLPRFFGLPTRQSFPESLALPPGWKPRARFAFFCGLAVIASFVMEAVGQPRLGCVLRAATILLYFFREVPFHRAGFGGGPLALGLRISLLAIPTGFILIAIWPDRISSFLHVVFISGFSLLAFIVASRVILGHSGQSDKFRAPLKSLFLLIALVVFAMLTRVTADWMPAICLTHYAYAALLWILGVLIWSIAILPAVRLPDP
jgi:uncharacterized protein involved in response to NO